MDQKKEKKLKNKIYPEQLKPHHNVQIPVEVLMHEGLDCFAIMVFGYMKLRFQFFQNKGLPYCESNSTIANATAMSRSKVIESINKLESAGFLIREMRNRLGVDKTEQTNIYTVVDCLAKDSPIFKPKQVKKISKVVDYPVQQHYPDYEEDPF